MGARLVEGLFSPLQQWKVADAGRFSLAHLLCLRCSDRRWCGRCRGFYKSGDALSWVIAQDLSDTLFVVAERLRAATLTTTRAGGLKSGAGALTD